MAGIKHTITTNYKNDAGSNVVADVLVLTATAEENFREVVAPGSFITVLLNIDVSQIVSFFIESTGACTFDTQAHGGAGGETFALAAGHALAWNNTVDTSLYPCPLTINVTTGLFFSNAGATDITVVGGFLLDL